MAVCITLLSFTIGSAQENILKINVGSLVLGNISLQDEYSINQNSSIALGISFLPKRGLPSVITNKDSTNNLVNFNMGGFSITPEYRFYTAGHGPTGFYIAPYFRYARYSTDNYPYTWTDDAGAKRNFNLSGDWTVAGIGVMIGSQWKLGDQFTFDWWIIGGAFGKNGGTYTGTGVFSSSDQDQIRQKINDVSVPTGSLKTTVDATSVKVEYSPGTPAFRGFGFCFGYVFGK